MRSHCKKHWLSIMLLIIRTNRIIIRVCASVKRSSIRGTNLELQLLRSVQTDQQVANGNQQHNDHRCNHVRIPGVEQSTCKKTTNVYTTKLTYPPGIRNMHHVKLGI